MLVANNTSYLGGVFSPTDYANVNSLLSFVKSCESCVFRRQTDGNCAANTIDKDTLNVHDADTYRKMWAYTVFVCFTGTKQTSAIWFCEPMSPPFACYQTALPFCVITHIAFDWGSTITLAHGFKSNDKPKAIPFVLTWIQHWNIGRSSEWTCAVNCMWNLKENAKFE